VSGDATAIVERIFKALILMPILGLVGWWIFSNWIDKTLSAIEAAIGFALLGVAAILGTASITAGGWGFVGILATIYLALLVLVCYEYIFWRKREEKFLEDEIARYQAAIARDPRNAAAYSFLGKTYMKLGLYEDAVKALEQALALDPTSKPDQYMLEDAKAWREKG
jgi:tetratricopeptide (TPR) repeat protein